METPSLLPLPETLRLQALTRIKASVTRLETLASLTSGEEKASSEAARAYRLLAHEETARVVAVLTEQIRALPE